MLEKMLYFFIGFLVCLLLISFLIIKYRPEPKTITKIETVEKTSYIEGKSKMVYVYVSPGNPAPTPYLEANVPVQGEIKTESLKVEFTGNTHAVLVGDELSLNTTFNPNAKITYKAQKQPKLELGAYCGSLQSGVNFYGKYNVFDNPRLNLWVGWDREWRVGVSYKL